MTLQDICEDYKSEDEQYECKLNLNRDDPFSWLKTIDGFANAKGGTLFLGVEDKTNKLIGFSDALLDKEKLYFYKEVKEHIEQSLSITSKTYEYIANEKRRYVLAITIEEAKRKPVILRMHGNPFIFMRRDGFTSGATSEEIVYMARQFDSPKYDLDKTDIKFDFANFTKLRQFYFDNVGTELNEKQLASIGFFDEKGNLYKGSNLFRDDYDGKDLEIVCSMYRGLTRGDNELISSSEYKGNAIDCYKFAFSYVDLRMNHGFIKKDTSRIDIDAYPRRSLFEAIINAIAHKDYYIEGTAIHLDMFIDRICISSPGCLYGKGELAKTFDLSRFASRRRNELISNIFVLSKAMEAKGTGFEKIEFDYKDASIKHKPFVYSKNNQFSIVLPDLTYKGGIDVAEESIMVSSLIENATRFDIPTLSYCYEESRSINEIASRLGIANSSFFRKNVIANLEQQGFLIKGKKGNKAVYMTNAEKIKIA